MRKAIAAFLEERPEIERVQIQQRDLDCATERLEYEMTGKIGEQDRQIQALLAHVGALQTQVCRLGAEPVPALPSSVGATSAAPDAATSATMDYSDTVARLVAAKREAAAATAEVWASAMAAAACADAGETGGSSAQGASEQASDHYLDSYLVRTISEAMGCQPDEAFRALQQTGCPDDAIELLLSTSNFATDGTDADGFVTAAPFVSEGPRPVGGHHGEVLQLRLVAMQQALNHLHTTSTALGDFSNVNQLMMRDEVQRMHETLLV
jgi:hypothetical protein